MRFDVVVNPAGASGGAWKLYKELEPVFRSSGSEVKVWRSSETESITDICRRLTSQGSTVRLVIIGGDGTANEALNGIVSLEDTLFAVIPSGTGNDLVRDMGLPKSREALARRILEGRVRRLSDIGETVFYGEQGTVVRRFNISSDIGFGAATCALAERSGIKPVLNRLGLGRLIYLIEAIRVCFTSKPVFVKIRRDGVTETFGRCLCAISMNHCHEGGGFKFCPNADFTDGKLDMCIGSGLTKLGFLRMLPYAYAGKHLKLQGIYERRCETVELRSRRPMWVHTDGEVLGMAKRASMRVLPEKLKLMM